MAVSPDLPGDIREIHGLEITVNRKCTSAALRRACSSMRRSSTRSGTSMSRKTVSGVPILPVVSRCRAHFWSNGVPAVGDPWRRKHSRAERWRGLRGRFRSHALPARRRAHPPGAILPRTPCDHQPPAARSASGRSAAGSAKAAGDQREQAKEGQATSSRSPGADEPMAPRQRVISPRRRRETARQCGRFFRRRGGKRADSAARARRRREWRDHRRVAGP